MTLEIDLSAVGNLVAQKLSPKQTDFAHAFNTPGELAKALDGRTIQTPALDLIDEKLVQVAIAVEALFARRKVFEQLVDAGVDQIDAAAFAESKVPPIGLSRLIISMPPQEGKSQRTSRRFPTWLLLRYPHTRIAIASYAHTTARRWGRVVRDDLINNQLLAVSQASSAADEWELQDYDGGVYSVGIAGGLTGRPVECLIIDDPIKDREQANSITYRDNVWDWWTDVAEPRLAPGAPVVLILTRWHEDDLAGRLIAADDGDVWEVLNIPALADHDPAKGQTDPLGREPGEWLQSARGRTVAQWIAKRISVGMRTFTSLYQGRPSPDAGDVLQRQWWQRFQEKMWTYDPEADSYHANGFTNVMQSWDMAFKDTKASDFVVGQVWAVRGSQSYLLDQVHERMTFTQTIAAFRRMTKRWPQAIAKLVEDKANGTAVIDSLRKEIGGIIPITPKESKYARASAIAPVVEAGNVFIPASDVSGVALFDVEDFVEECAAFDNGAHDDQVDAMSQALARIYLQGSDAQSWFERMAKACPVCSQFNDLSATKCSKCGGDLVVDAILAETPKEEPFTIVPSQAAPTVPSQHQRDVMDAIRQAGGSGSNSFDSAFWNRR